MHAAYGEFQKQFGYIYELIRSSRGKWFRSRYPAPHRYLFGLIVTAFGILLKICIEYFIGFTLQPFLFASTAVMISASYGGIGPGLMSTVITGIIIDYLFMNPANTSFPFEIHHTIQVSIFFFEGIVIGVLSDALREARIEAERMNQKIIQILESISDAFCIVDKNWKVTYVNANAEKIFHAARYTLVGKTLWKISPRMINGKYKRKFREILRNNTPDTCEIFSTTSKQWLHFHIYPNTDGLLLYIHDISARKAQEKNKDNFISIASHELKNPLTSLKAYGQILAKHVARNDDIVTASYVEKVNTQINTVVDLTSDLLAVSRIQTGRLEIHKTTVMLDDIVKNVVEDMRKISSTHTLLLQGKTTKLVSIDPARIRQVLVNLISNAMKYSPDADTVIIRLEDDDYDIRVRVRDFGIGIPAEDQTKIFWPFYRGKHLPSADVTSVGLGLYISSEIVRYHCGKLLVESTPGKGATFTMTLPTRQSERQVGCPIHAHSGV